MSNKIINTLEALRQTRGQTQEELAQALGVTRQTIISIEKGRYTPSLKLALSLARYFSCAVEDIFTYET